MRTREDTFLTKGDSHQGLKVSMVRRKWCVSLQAGLEW